MEKRKFKIRGMSCAACSARVERAVSALPFVDECDVSLLLGEMSVVGAATDTDIICAVENAGYEAVVVSSESDSSQSEDLYESNKREITSAARRLLYSGGLLLVLMYISMGHLMWSWPLPKLLSESPLLIGSIELVLSSLIMVINKQFFEKGVRGIVNLAPNMDTLVALGSSVSYVYSVALMIKMSLEIKSDNVGAAYHTLHGLYFESAAMILVLITVGKLLEGIAKGRTTSAIRSLVDLTPKTARVIRDGLETEIPVSHIKRGDIFIVKKGDSIACDGVIVDGEISTDESALTGESLPKDALAGEKVFGATLVLSGWAKIEAQKIGEETAIAEIIKMVKEASSSKAPVAKTADKISGIFVPAVLLISLITFSLWMLVGAYISDAVSRAVTVLVISCPCALGLATPVAIMVGSGVGAKYGVLFKNAASLEAAGKIKVVAFDKTGTITEGSPEVCEIKSYLLSEEDMLSVAAAIERKSEHPIAAAVVDFCIEKGYSSDKECDDYESHVGGVSGIVDGVKYFIGNARFISEKTEAELPEDFYKLTDDGKTVLTVATQNNCLGVIAISDKIKEDSEAAIAVLHALGIKTVMITGDNRISAKKVAERVGIKEVLADVLPGDKASAVKELSRFGSVAMVGDGVNDSVALTEADVGIAIGKGTDVAINSADVVLTRVSLMGVATAIKLGRRVLFNVYENLFWAFSYNIIGIPLAAGAFISLFGWSLTPMFGAAAMSVSSFLVVMNALRLNLYNPQKIRVNENKSFQKTANNVKLIEDIRKEKQMNTLTVKINGMMCPHCSGRVKTLLEAKECVTLADVSHERGDAVITLSSEPTDSVISELKKIINDAGYETP